MGRTSSHVLPVQYDIGLRYDPRYDLLYSGRRCIVTIYSIAVAGDGTIPRATSLILRPLRQAETAPVFQPCATDLPRERRYLSPYGSALSLSHSIFLLSLVSYC